MGPYGAYRINCLLPDRGDRLIDPGHAESCACRDNTVTDGPENHCEDVCGALTGPGMTDPDTDQFLIVRAINAIAVTATIATSTTIKQSLAVMPSSETISFSYMAQTVS